MEKNQPYCLGVRSRAALTIDVFRGLKGRKGIDAKSFASCFIDMMVIVADPPKRAPFTFVGLGRSLYSRELMQTGNTCQLVSVAKGLSS